MRAVKAAFAQFQPAVVILEVFPTAWPEVPEPTWPDVPDPTRRETVRTYLSESAAGADGPGKDKPKSSVGNGWPGRIESKAEGATDDKRVRMRGSEGRRTLR